MLASKYLSAWEQKKAAASTPKCPQSFETLKGPPPGEHGAIAMIGATSPKPSASAPCRHSTCHPMTTTAVAELHTK